jgi:GTP-binding protein HflX
VAREAPGNRRQPQVDIDGLRHGDHALVIHPDLQRGAKAANGVHYRTPASRLAEACGLALAIDLEIVAAEVVRVSEPRPATLIGSGKVERLKEIIEEQEIALVVVDAALTPVQQRNLEQAWKAKVIDRTGLILEIFGERARTAEGKLQVELAALSYQRSRLVKSWTHLERQRGGFGFIGGPGESQIEIDRRLIDERIVRIKRDLDDVKLTRSLHRRARNRVPYPFVALVGYTNAGKSTLFNTLTKAGVYVANQLFATLDTTSRRLYLGQETGNVVVSDTVGFVRELPHQLVAAFRATLEETIHADLLLHVVDGSSPVRMEQIEQVNEVLREIGADHIPQILVWNKIDAAGLEPGVERDEYDKISRVFISAHSGAGLDLLREAIVEATRPEPGAPEIALADAENIPNSTHVGPH